MQHLLDFHSFIDHSLHACNFLLSEHCGQNKETKGEFEHALSLPELISRTHCSSKVKILLYLSC